MKNGEEHELWLMQKKIRPHLYVLDEKNNPVPAESPYEWAIWYESAERIVRVSKVNDCRVSTVFLGVDMAMDGQPILWESMFFDEDGNDMDIDRCGGTYQDALKMHERMRRGIVGKLLDLA